MTIQGVGGGTNQLQYMNAAEQVIGPGGKLAALMLAAEQGQQESEHQELEVARSTFKHELASEVALMHEAADQVFWGAVTQGAISAASGALNVAGALSRCPPDLKSCDPISQLQFEAAMKPSDLETTGGSLAQLAGPAGKLVSNSDGQHSLAEAKAHAGAGEQAQWALDDAHQRLESSKQRVDRTVDWVDGMAEKDAAASSAVLGNMA
jgi:hypothetical protein